MEVFSRHICSLRHTAAPAVPSPRRRVVGRAWLAVGRLREGAELALRWWRGWLCSASSCKLALLV